MALVFTPRPICLGFTPPVPVLALAPLALCVVWLISAAKVMELDLYATVLTFAMLLPITSILVWCALRPDTPAKSDLIIVICSS
jgi:hypothetical protein